MKKQPKTFTGKIVKRVQRRAATKLGKLKPGEEIARKTWYEDELEKIFEDYNIDQELGDEAQAGALHFYPIACY